MFGRFIKKTAVKAAGLAITQYAAKAALHSETGKRLMSSAATNVAKLAGNFAKQQVVSGFNNRIKYALPSSESLQTSVANAQSAT